MDDILEIMNEQEEFLNDNNERDEFGNLLTVDEKGNKIFSYDKAREITDAIRSAATATYILIYKAHELRADKALGYKTWAEYCKNEFEISASRSYQLINLNKAIREIEAASPEGTKIKLTEAQLRDLKRELPNITSRIKDETEGMDSDAATDRVNEIILEERELAKAEEAARKKREQELSQAQEDGYHAGLEAAADAILGEDGKNDSEEGDDFRPSGKDTSGAKKKDDGWDNPNSGSWEANDGVSTNDSLALFNFFNILTSVAKLPQSPKEFVSKIPDGRIAEVNENIHYVTKWFDEFAEAWERR